MALGGTSERRFAAAALLPFAAIGAAAFAIRPPAPATRPTSQPAASAPALPAEPPAAIRFEKLENGLRICVIEDQAAANFTVQLWFRAGSVHDSPGRPGLTHVTLCALDRRAGARSPATSRFAQTFEDASCLSISWPIDAAAASQPAPQLSQALEDVRAWLRPDAIQPPEVAGALEAAAATPNPANSIRLLRATLYSDHPYQHPPQFVADSLRDIAADALNEHMDRWFSPTHATLFIIGAVKPEAAFEAAQRELRSIPWRDGPRRADFDTPPDVRIDLLPRDTAGSARPPEMLFGWRAPMFDSPDAAAIEVLMHRLCNAMDGSLHRRLAEAGYAVRHWHLDSWRESGMLALHVAPRPGASALAPDAIRAIEQSLDAAAREPCREIELNRARAQAVRAALLRRSSNRAMRLALHELIGGDILLDEYELPRLRRTTAGELMLAARYLLEVRRVVMQADGDGDGESAKLTRPIKPVSASGLTTGATPVPQSLITGGTPVPQVHQMLMTGGRPVPNNVAITSMLDLAIVRSTEVEIAVARIELRENDGPGVAHRQALAAALMTDRVADYLSYHGLAIVVEEAAIYGSGPPERLDSLLELIFAGLAEKNAGRLPPLRISILSNVDPAAVEAAVRRALPTESKGP